MWKLMLVFKIYQSSMTYCVPIEDYYSKESCEEAAKIIENETVSEDNMVAITKHFCIQIPYDVWKHL